METLEKIFAAKLLKVKAIKLQPTNPFTWASGWKSPFYCDNRKTLSYPGLRSFVKIEIGRLISERFPEPMVYRANIQDIYRSNIFDDKAEIIKYLSKLL